MGNSNHARKSAQRQLVGSRDCRVGWGVFHAKGRWSKKLFPSLESVCFWGVLKEGPWDVREFAGMSRASGGVQEVGANQIYAHSLRAPKQFD